MVKSLPILIPIDCFPLDENEVGRDFARQKKLQINLGRDVDLFAYPNGQGADIPSHAINVLKENGFIGACSTFGEQLRKERPISIK